jgi:predicted  nucleic acid-binding Zn-ribbon protein
VTRNQDGSTTYLHGPEYPFGGFARDREDYLLDDLIEASQRAKDLEAEVNQLKAALADAESDVLDAKEALVFLAGQRDYLLGRAQAMQSALIKIRATGMPRHEEFDAIIGDTIK